MFGPSRDAGCPGWQGPASVMGRRISGSWAGCPAARDVPDVRAWGPDVWADLVQLRVSSVMGTGFPRVGWMSGLVRMSGLGVGCPAAREEPDVRASGRMSGLTGFSFGCVL